MRIVQVSEGEGPRVVAWEHVCDVRFIAEGTRRWLVLTYENGVDRNLEIHQARDLWWKIEDHRACREEPCYYRHEGDTAPRGCISCKLAEALEGVDCTVRPRPLPPPRFARPDRRAWLIAFLVFLLLLTLFGWANEISRKMEGADRGAIGTISTPPPAKSLPKRAYSGGQGTHENERGGESR